MAPKKSKLSRTKIAPNSSPDFPKMSSFSVKMPTQRFTFTSSILNLPSGSSSAFPNIPNWISCNSSSHFQHVSWHCYLSQQYYGKSSKNSTDIDDAKDSTSKWNKWPPDHSDPSSSS